MYKRSTTHYLVCLLSRLLQLPLQRLQRPSPSDGSRALHKSHHTPRIDRCWRNQRYINRTSGYISTSGRTSTSNNTSFNSNSNRGCCSLCTHIVPLCRNSNFTSTADSLPIISEQKTFRIRATIL